MIAAAHIWNCPTCGEVSEIQFKRCWNCGTDRDGRLDPNFRVETPAQITVTSHVSLLLGLAWLTGWIAFCVAVLAAAVVLESWIPHFWTVRLALAATLLLLCLLTAVFVNVLSRLYLWLRDYLYTQERAIEHSPATQNNPVELKGQTEND